MADGQELKAAELGPEARLGAALRRAREARGISLRALARRLYRSHSTLVEYERGHRLAPLDVAQAYENELGIASGTLVALHERARLERYGEDRSHRQTYVLRPVLDAPHQLPPKVPSFTGRRAELEKLRAMVAERTAQTVVISAIAGTAGVGKTALALQLAHELMPHFSDLQLFVNLHGYDALQRLSPGQVLDRFLRALGVAAEALPTEVDEQVGLYRSLLAGRRALVVLDNASSTEQVRPLLPGCSTCLVLVTSRRRLAALEGALLLDLDIMDPFNALDLLRKLAGAERVDAEPEAAIQIVALCGRLPLALRIAGGRLAARPVWSLSWLAGRLADEQTRLKELQVEDLEVRTSFALSYRDLDAPAARLFRRLGLVAGPDFAASVAAVLADIGPQEAEALLEELMNVHLLEAAPVPSRYRFHDLLRLYAREQVQAEDSEEKRAGAVRQMLDWYLATARAATGLLTPGRRLLPHRKAGERPEPAFATRAQTLTWFDAERANLVAATHQAAACGQGEIAWQLPNALWGLFYLRKHWGDWQESNTVGLRAARAAHDRQAEAWMLTNLGSAYRELRRCEEAVDCQRQALAISREIGDRWIEGLVLTCLGATHNNLRRPNEAIDYFQQALPILREVGYRRGEGLALHCLGESCRRLQRFAEAIDYGHQALGVYQAIGDRHYEGGVLNFTGKAYEELGRMDEAVECFECALRIHREVGSRWGEGEALRFLGLALQQTKRPDEARICWQEALTIFNEIGAPQAEDIRGLLDVTKVGENHVGTPKLL